MNISVCITVKDEQKSISELIERLLQQSVRPSEIIIVDAQSEDKTVEIIKHWQKKDKRIKLLVKKCTRSEGRNTAVELANGDIIAMTDAGCLPDNNWLKEISSPFKNKQVDISAGFYNMISENHMQKALSVFLGVRPSDFGVNFLPSTRSIAFRKNAWEKIGGFPIRLKDTAEDTVFNHKAIKNNLVFARVKSARVGWEMPKTLSNGLEKIFNYAKGDINSKIWFYPKGNKTSHNIKALSIFLRYFVGLILLVYYIGNKAVLLLLTIAFLIYLFYAFRKVMLKTGDINAGLWGVIIQPASDIAVMGGVLSAIFSNITENKRSES